MMSDDVPTKQELLPDPPTISLAPAIPINISHVTHHQSFHPGSPDDEPSQTISPFSHPTVDTGSQLGTVVPHQKKPDNYSNLNHDYIKRKYRRKYEHPEKIRDLMVEQQVVVDNLTTAVAGKMDVAAIGVLTSIIESLDVASRDEMSVSKATVDSGDKQRALFKCNICPLIATTLRELGGQVMVCEKALSAVAYLCRYSEENKQSVCLENCKGFGLSGVCELIVGALKRHGDEKKVVEAACDAIRTMCALESNRERLGNAGACETAVRSLTKYHSNPELCGWLCRAIGHLGNGSELNRESLGTAGACENIIMTLQKFPTLASVCTEACWAIRQICPTENNRARFANDFGPESILAVYKSHISYEPFVLEGVQALVNLISSEEDDLIPRITNSGFIGYALKSIKKLNESELVSKWIIHALYFLACEPKSVGKLVTYDVLDVLSVNLENHAGYEPVAEWGSRLAHKLFQVNGMSSKMRTAGLCEMIPSTVQRQAISASVSCVGCQAIGDLATDPANQQRLSAAGACEAVVGALKRHNASEDVVYNTCYAIHYLCMTQNNVSWMGAYGACEAVTNALNKHLATNEDVATNACSALASLAFKDEGNQVRLFTAGACLAIVTALHTHAKSPDVAENACRAVYNLCADNQNVRELGNKGACGLVVSAMQEHFGTPRVVTQCLLATYSLAVKVKGDKVHNGNTRKLVSKGAIEIVVAIMQKYAENEDVQRASAMAITSLARLEANRNKLGASGACDLIMNAMRIHVASAAVVCKLALAIDGLSAQAEGNKVKFIAAGAVDILLSAFLKHEKVGYLVADIFRALVTLSTVVESRAKIFAEPAFKMYVKAIKSHEKNQYVARWGSNMVYCAAISDENRSKLGSLKACEGVVNVLNRHGVKYPEVAEWASKAIFGLSLCADNKLKFNTTETCVSLTNSLNEHHKIPVVAEWATAAIVGVSATSQNRVKLGSACSALCLTLVDNIASTTITKLVCQAIYELSEEKSNQSLFYTAGVCDILITTLTHHEADKDLSPLICRAVSNVCSANTDSANKLGDLGGCELIVNGMSTHLYTQAYIQWACAAVTSMSKANPKNQTSFGAFGAVDAISRGMLAHKSSEVVVTQTTRAIRALTSNHPENTLKVSRHGDIIPGCMAAIKAHLMRQPVVEHSCWILATIEYKGPSSRLSHGGSLISKSESRPELAGLSRRDGVDVLEKSESTKGFGLPDDNASTLIDTTAADAAGITLSALSLNNPSASAADRPITPSAAIKPREFYSKPSNWDLLFTALQSHVNHTSTCKWIASAVSMFADQGKLSHPNLCDVLLICLDKHSDNDSVLQKILQAVGALSRSNAENNDRLSRGHACEIIDQIMSGYSEGNVVIYGLLPAIAGLADGNTANQNRFHSTPIVVKKVASIMYNELETEFISQWGCAAVAALAKGHVKNQQKLSTVCGYVADVITAHKSNPVVCMEACKAISALAHMSITNRNRLGASDACAMVPIMLSENLPKLLSQSLQHMESSSLLYWSVKAIADLAANNPNNQAKLGISGACECLVRALQRDSLPGEVQQEVKFFTAVFWALGNIVQLGKGPTMNINDAAGASVKMEPSVGSSNTAGFGGALHMDKLGATGLGNFIAGAKKASKNTTRLLEAGVADWSHVVLLRYINYPSVVMWGCRAINNMAKSGKLRANLLEVGLQEVVQKVFETHAGNSEVIDWAVLAKETLNMPV